MLSTYHFTSDTGLTISGNCWCQEHC